MHCTALQQLALAFTASPEQQKVVDDLQMLLDEEALGQLYAVRSSSTQEDLVGASFAGGYLTCLGVRADSLFDAVRRCYASQFDLRVHVYKQSLGVKVIEPAMAVVVQQQLASEVAGVAFSLNPLNNDFDQALINANWGQGETVVAGEVTPDQWVVDKLDGSIVEQSLGDKAISRWLDDGAA